ncbi:hypothetical protein BDN70DRAFT_887422 [Pholiota conissans]|uniref:Uncharacterized protein n=1 Tax=Pholiota conissans TaxID=109636 RepID=A0A9P5YQZ0_9AGAR|nr:hypothetical protein BDN70DRAFT_887422 [Pholiota conissans]
MRYLSSLPLPRRARSPGRPSDQRSQPTTCILSLTSVTVSMASTAPAGMDIDTSPLSDLSNSNGVPFPSSKRTHSLLRATPSLSQCSSEHDEQNSDTCGSNNTSDPDFNPPRKRTRTSAISSPSRPRSQRCSSSPPRVSLPSVHLSGSSTPLPLPAAPSCIDLMAMKPIPSTRSSPWRRRRMIPGEQQVLLHLYRTLVYGLEVRHEQTTAIDEATIDKTRLDVQDALLAQHLRTYLLANGAAAHTLVVDANAIAQEGRPKAELDDSGAMLIDDDSETTTTHTHTVLSYPQLVATLHIRRYLHPRRPSTKPKRPSPGILASKLSQSISFD